MSVIKDVKRKIALLNSIDPANLTGTDTDVNGATVDTQDSVGVGLAAYVGESGDVLSGSLKLELYVEHSDQSGSGFVAVADADIDAAISGANQTGTYAVIDDAAEDDAIYKVNYIGNKRYVRGSVRLVGAHATGTPLCVMGMLLPAHKPAS